MTLDSTTILGVSFVILGVIGGLYVVIKKGDLPAFTIPSLPKRERNESNPKPMRNATTPEPSKVGRNIPIEITAVNETGTAQVIVAKGRVPKNKKLVLVRYPDLPKVGLYFVNLKALWKDNKLHFQREICEPIDEKGQPVKCEELERMLVDSGMVQITDAVAILGSPIRLTRSMIIVLLFTGLVFLSVGLSLNSLFHLVPNVSVHWLPNVPAGGH